jgi:hypothetical protein
MIWCKGCTQRKEVEGGSLLLPGCEEKRKEPSSFFDGSLQHEVICGQYSGGQHNQTTSSSDTAIKQGCFQLQTRQRH